MYKFTAGDVKAENVNNKLNLMVYFTTTNVGTVKETTYFSRDVALDNLGGQYEIPDQFSLRYDNPEIIEEGDMYPGVTRNGWVQFPAMPLETKHITLIKTEWSNMKPNVREYRFDFYLE